MKSSRNARQPYGGGLDRRNDRRGGKRQGSEKAKLDRKSSRGMIYENEELRLRTININAEVERGQSDIKRLRRENEQLRREIWTLRDECDRLNKRFKAKLIDHDHGACGSARCSGESCHVRGSNGAGGGGGCDSHSNSEDSDSCDTCRAADYDDDVCSDDCCLNGTCQQAAKLAEDYGGSNATMMSSGKGDATAAASSSSTSNVANAAATAATSGVDHLSVVSEETLSNADMQSSLPPPPPPPPSSAALPQHSESLAPCLGSGIIGPLTPLTPVELVANQLNDMQTAVPPLSYFESVLQQHMVPTTAGPTPDAVSMETRMRQTNGWDYNLESPFAQRKFPAAGGGGGGAAPKATSAAAVAATTVAAPVTLTTFVPTPPPPSSTLPAVRLPPEADAAAAATNRANAATPAIETVAITTMPTSAIATSAAAAAASAAFATATSFPSPSGSPKHFFAPLKPRLKLNTTLANKTLIAASVPAVPPLPPPSSKAAEPSMHAYNPPDLFVTNGLASPYHRPAKPPAPSVTPPPPLPQRSGSQTSSQTDSVNLKSILNEIETISEDILAIQMEKAKSRENLCETNTFGKPLQTDDKVKKPYRSEMNLLLTYDGSSNPTITPANVTTKLNSTGANSECRAQSQERDQSESPSVSVPDPMLPFPVNRTYIGFEQFDAAATIGPPVSGSGGGGQKLPMPPTAVGGETRAQITLKSPPTPPARQRPLPPNGIATTTAQLNLRSDAQARVGLAPNKSHLYTAIANAAAKRAQYRAAAANSNSLKGEAEPTQATIPAVIGDNQQSPNRLEAPSSIAELSTAIAISEAAKKKARRVSIICGDESTATPTGMLSPEQPWTVEAAARSQAQNAHSTLSLPSIASPTAQPVTLTTIAATTTASCTDLSAASALQNPALKCLRPHLSHSTPNSPHSSRRRRSNSNSMTLANPEHQRKTSQDSTEALASAAAIAAARTRCSRRHSEGTIAGAATNTAGATATANGVAQQQQQQRISGTSSGGGGGHHHHHRHHHHHHHHPHSALLCGGGSNTHHSHHSRQDSNHDTGTSLSDHDRMSNSMASSRESSTTFSMRSQRRKISISSHTGGKIPWCGCWGNGCL